MDNDIILWGSGTRRVPPRPEFPERYPEIDERHWHDLEFAGWSRDREPQPVSPGDGPAGKRVISIHHLDCHPYMEEYDYGLRREAERFGIGLEIYQSGWDPELESRLVDRAVAARPDLLILSPESAAGSSALFARVHAAGIPLIASNLLPEPEAFKYLLAWTGPDDWGQFRLLSRKFAELLGGEGGYCIVNHMPGSSAYFARRWAVVTELDRIAPRMELLDAAETGLGTEATRRATLGWVDRFGDRLRGIICADDSLAQMGVNRALAERGREDVVRVANGSTVMGMRFLKEGSLKAITYQNPALDGSLPIRVAVDWFNGLEVEPMRYLPVYLIDAGNIDEFLLMSREEPRVEMDALAHMVSEGDSAGARALFAELTGRLRHQRFVSEEYFRGLCIEILSRLVSVARSAELPPRNLYGDYEDLFKQLFQRPTAAQTLSWLEGMALRIADECLGDKAVPRSLGERIKAHVDRHYREPLSLKVLSSHFGISAAYLGQVFKETTGSSFNNYLNELRIRAASRLLAGRNVKAKDVAMAVGYADPNYFYSVFKKVTGKNPSDIQG
jgi:ABC-type sugar transport system substrate-binding protein/AraC-like DNA-binding protein